MVGVYELTTITGNATRHKWYSKSSWAPMADLSESKYIDLGLYCTTEQGAMVCKYQSCSLQMVDTLFLLTISPLPCVMPIGDKSARSIAKSSAGSIAKSSAWYNLHNGLLSQFKIIPRRLVIRKT